MYQTVAIFPDFDVLTWENPLMHLSATNGHWLELLQVCHSIYIFIAK